jgi:hypothetical protein
MNVTDVELGSSLRNAGRETGGSETSMILGMFRSSLRCLQEIAQFLTNSRID